MFKKFIWSSIIYTHLPISMFVKDIFTYFFAHRYDGKTFEALSHKVYIVPHFCLLTNYLWLRVWGSYILKGQTIWVDGMFVWIDLLLHQVKQQRWQELKTKSNVQTFHKYRVLLISPCPCLRRIMSNPCPCPCHWGPARVQGWKAKDV